MVRITISPITNTIVIFTMFPSYIVIFNTIFSDIVSLGFPWKLFLSPFGLLGSCSFWTLTGRAWQGQCGGLPVQWAPAIYQVGALPMRQAGHGSLGSCGQPPG